MTTPEQERCRDEYEFVDGFVVGGRCERCGGPVEDWAESVPCCGGEYECENTIYCHACHACRIMTDEF